MVGVNPHRCFSPVGVKPHYFSEWLVNLRRCNSIVRKGQPLNVLCDSFDINEGSLKKSNFQPDPKFDRYILSSTIKNIVERRKEKKKPTIVKTKKYPNSLFPVYRNTENYIHSSWYSKPV